MKKIISTLAICCAMAVSAWAQNESPDYFTGDTTARIQTQAVNSVVFKKNKPKFGVEVGSSFSTAGKYGSSFSNYVAPHVSFQPIQKLTLTAGVMFENTQLINTSVLTADGVSKMNANVNSAYFYGKADYNLTERLKITGTILYGMNRTPYQSVIYNGNGLQSSANPLIYSIGAMYKITDNMSIGFEVRGVQGVDYRQPYTRFSSSPFDNGFGL